MDEDLLNAPRRYREMIYDKKDIEFELMYISGQMPHNRDNCQMCGYCTGENGSFTFSCLEESRC